MKKEEGIIRVWTTPISPALEEALRLQRLLIWTFGLFLCADLVLGILLIGGYL